MSKMISQTPEQPEGPPLGVTHTRSSGRGSPVQAGLPLWLWIAFGIVLLVGVIGIGGKRYFAEAASFDAMKSCEATAVITGARMVNGQRVSETLDGLSDSYPFLLIAAQREAICDVFSQCDTQPLEALKLFRRGLDAEGNKNSRMIALACAVYLARAQTHPVPDLEQGVLQKEDIERILAHLDPATETDADVRKVALRALSDLTILSDEKGAERYEKRPAGIDGTVKTHPDKLNGKNVLLVRWSSPEAALAWWKENAKPPAHWDEQAQRFTIP